MQTDCNDGDDRNHTPAKFLHQSERQREEVEGNDLLQVNGV
jgi:hypothetical protein